MQLLNALPMGPAIYSINSLIDGKRYIGSSVQCARRCKHHVYLLRVGRHKNQYLQRAYEKHGPANFEFQLLRDMPGANPIALLTVEQELISALSAADPEKGYNIHPTPISGSVPASSIENARLRAALKGRRRGVLTDGGRAAKSEATQLWWAEPSNTAFASETMRSVWLRSSHRNKVAEAWQKRVDDPEKLAAMRACLEANRLASEEKRLRASRDAAAKKRGRRPEDDQVLCDWIVAEYESGTSVRQIGISVGMAHNSVAERLRRRGVDIAMRNQGRANGRTSATALAKAGIHDLASFDAEVKALHQSGVCVNAISVHYKVSCDAVRSSLHRTATPIRGRGGMLSKTPQFRVQRKSRSASVVLGFPSEPQQLSLSFDGHHAQ